MIKLSKTYVSNMVKHAFVEDKARFDITSKALFASQDSVRAAIYAKESCVVAGMEFAVQTFAMFDPSLDVIKNLKDGVRAKKGQKIVSLSGSCRSIFSAERTALNFLGHLSGIATLTKSFVCLANPVKIYDTRKTMPGLRLAQKYAVRVGGGNNHRMDMQEHFLFKDNHINTYMQLYQSDCLVDIIAQAKK